MSPELLYHLATWSFISLVPSTFMKAFIMTKIDQGRSGVHIVTSTHIGRKTSLDTEHIIHDEHTSQKTEWEVTSGTSLH